MCIWTGWSHLAAAQLNLGSLLPLAICTLLRCYNLTQSWAASMVGTRRLLHPSACLCSNLVMQKDAFGCLKGCSLSSLKIKGCWICFFGQQVESCSDDRNALCFEDSPVPGPWTEASLLNMLDESLISHRSLIGLATGKSSHKHGPSSTHRIPETSGEPQRQSFQQLSTHN